jgi:PAS domain S-box-containing protein
MNSITTEEEQAISGIALQLEEIFEHSEQAVYIYMDDINKVCNGTFATMLGYKSPKEWAAVKENFPDAFVSRKSQHTLISTYQAAMARFVGGTIQVTWKTKDGREVPTKTMLVPIRYGNQTMALHFIEEV